MTEPSEPDNTTPPDDARQNADRRRDVVDRRSGLDRRTSQGRTTSGLERRRGPGRRLSDFTRSAEEGEHTREQFLFVSAIDAFKRANNKTFPAWTDVLEVVRLLGYRKTAPSELSLPNIEDWTEPPDAPANVRDESDEKAA